MTPSTMSATTAPHGRPLTTTAIVAEPLRRRIERCTPDSPGGYLNVGTSNPLRRAARPSERAVSPKRAAYVSVCRISMASIIDGGCDSHDGRVSDWGWAILPDVDPIDDTTAEPDLNPAQQAVLDQLGATAAERPEFPDDLRHHLRAALETAVDPHLDGLPAGEDLFVHKHRLAQVHGCEAKFLADELEEFEWRVPTARGTIVHKAVELAVNWRREVEPPVLVDEALARYESDQGGLGHWLRGCGEVERAELRSESLDAFTKYMECWPPLKPAWRPVTESRLRAELCGGRLILAGKVDLTLGRAVGQRAGKVIVDLKTGGSQPVHREDLRFYALIETLRIGVPPRLLASYYLDQANFVPEEVTEDTLMASVARLSDGVGRLVELLHGDRAPTRIPGPPCRWCPVYDTCDEGQAHRSAFDDPT